MGTKDSQVPWRKGMWAIGVPFFIDEKDAFNVLKYYDNLTKKEKGESK